MINIKTIGTLTFFGCFFMGFISCNPVKKLQPSVLKDALDDKFYIGTAMDSAQIVGIDTGSIRVIKEQFNAVVAENIMKSEIIQPEKGVFNFRPADQIVEFGEKNNMFVTGHVLTWHSQLPEWFCTYGKGNNVSPETLKQHMKTHISTLVGRYKGRVKGWDVINEAIENDGSWRNDWPIIGRTDYPLLFDRGFKPKPMVETIIREANTIKE
jgi:endo-1,4-beta-xylanase